MNNQKQKFNRSEIIRSVKTPLGFFVLVVLIAEAFFGLKASTASGASLMVTLIIMAVILLFVALIVALIAYYRPEALYGKRTQGLPIEASIIYPPTEKTRYNKLFDNFSDCDYYAFNAPFEVEHSGKQIFNESIKTHSKRYKSGIASRYLFFDKKSYEKAESFFKALSKHIGRETVSRKIECILWKKPPYFPEYTFFVGKKGKKKKKPAVVLYPRAVMEKGIPRAVIYIEGEELLFSVLSEYFIKQWNQAKKNE